MAAWHTFPGSPHSYGHSSSLVMPCLFILASSWELQPYRSSRLAFVAEIGPQPMLNVSFIWYLAPPTEMLARCFTVLIRLFLTSLSLILPSLVAVSPLNLHHACKWQMSADESSRELLWRKVRVVLSGRAMSPCGWELGWPGNPQ